VSERRATPFRWAAAVALLAIASGGLDSHGDAHRRLAQHGSLRATEFAQPTSDCLPGQRAHFDAFERRVASPCDACLRGVERRVVAAQLAGLAAAPSVRWLSSERPLTFAARAILAAIPVRGPPELDSI
jgi:hypothetical protein